MSKFGAAGIDKKGAGLHGGMCLRRLEPPQPSAGIGEQVVDRSTCHDGIVGLRSTPARVRLVHPHSDDTSRESGDAGDGPDSRIEAG